MTYYTNWNPDRDPLRPVPAAHPWPTNADLIEAIGRSSLPYLTDDALTIDLTWGEGNWWNHWRPTDLVGCDLDPEKSPIGRSVDFTDTGFPPRAWGVVVFDPPYKLNGTPTHDVDARYGVGVAYTSRTDRHLLMLSGLTEAARLVAPGGYVLTKSQAQVNGGRVRWQPRMMDRHAATLGLDLVDEFLRIGGRAQPTHRPCRTCPGEECERCAGAGSYRVAPQHAAHNYSTLQVFTRRRPAKDV